LALPVQLELNQEEAMAINSMDDLFIHALQDVYYAENQIAKALPEMMGKVTEPALFDHLEHHLDETREHIKRLEQIFQALGQTPQGVTCKAILGLIEEGEEFVREIGDEKVRDAAILASAQAIEHYEINRYGTLIAWADQLGKQKVVDRRALGNLELVDLLLLTLGEEKSQDAKLTALAESKVNRHAA
jgi:ferritin-like metal-binding protein YciE